MNQNINLNNSLHLALLKQAIIVIEETARRNKLTAASYNVFEVLDRLRDENKGHSGFISHLLDPKASHSQGPLYLEKFLSALFPDRNFDINCDWKVITEKSVSDKSGSDKLYGRIDIWLEGPRSIIVIENKIEAGDQPRQLERYIDYVKQEANGKDIYVIYLTPNASPPSDNSLGVYANGKLEIEDLIYLNIGYYPEIYEWIEDCYKASAPLPEIRETLSHYKKTIRRITDRITDEELGMSFERLLRSKEDIVAAIELGKAGSDALEKREGEFWKKLKEGLASKFNGDVDIFHTGKLGGRYYGVSIKVAVDGDYELRYNLERDRSNGVIYPGFMQTPLKSQSFSTAKQFSDALKDFAQPAIKEWPSNNYWMGWGDIDFPHSFKADADNFIGFVEDDVLERAVELVVNISVEVIKPVLGQKSPTGVRITISTGV